MSDKNLKPNERYSALIVQEEKTINLEVPLPLGLLAAFSIYVMIIPTMITDIFAFQYQLIYFSIMQIPKIRRDDYVIMDRHMLKNLNWKQKINCIYCEYVNGVSAYAKAISNQTEIYSCAIKHSIEPKGHEHHKDFYEYDEFLKPEASKAPEASEKNSSK